MLLRTIPLSLRMSETVPLAELEPSDGKGPLVSWGSTMQLPAVVVLAVDALDVARLVLEVLAVSVLPSEPPQATRAAAAPPEASHSRAWRLCCSRCSRRRCAMTARSCSRPRWWSWSWSSGRWTGMSRISWGNEACTGETTRRLLLGFAATCQVRDSPDNCLIHWCA